MPVINVEIVTRANEQFNPELAALLADRTGEIFRSAPGTTWVKVVLIPDECYAENEVTEKVYPVFVSVLKTRLPSPDSLHDEIARLTSAIAQICGRPEENVHIIYLPEAAGRVAFGGKVVPD